MIVAGVALAGIGLFGLRGVQQKQTQFTVKPSTTPAALYSAAYQPSSKPTIERPFPVQPPPNGLLKDRYLDLDKGMSANILERHNGLPMISSRKLDPPAPYAPSVQGPRVTSEDIRQHAMDTFKKSMSPYRNDEAPVPRVNVGRGLGYDASVPAADGFHPRLRVVMRNTGADKISLPGRVIAGRSVIEKPTALPGTVNRAAPNTYFEQSAEYITAAPSASGAGVPEPYIRLNFQETYTNRGTTLPGLKNADGCEEVSEDTSRYGVGPGPAGSVQPAAMDESGYRGDTMRTTDRGWNGIWGAGPTSAASQALAETTRSPYILKNQSRDATGFAPDRLWSAGPSRPESGGVASMLEPMRTTNRQLIAGIPVINTAPIEAVGSAQSSLRDRDFHSSDQVPLPQRAMTGSSELYVGAPTGIASPSHGPQLESIKQGRLSEMNSRQIIDNESLAAPGPHAAIGNTPRLNFDIFSTREQIADNGERMAGSNAGFSGDRISGEHALRYEMPVPRADHATEGYIPNLDVPVPGGMLRSRVQYDPNQFEVMDDRLEVSVETQPQNPFVEGPSTVQ